MLLLPLAHKHIRYLRADSLLPFVPQRSFLGLISTGEKYAVASKSGFALEGSWMWNWKDHIDRTWMAQYGSDLDKELEKMMVMKNGNNSERQKDHSLAGETARDSPLGSSSISALLAMPSMRCGGCGAKVGASVLSRVMQRLDDEFGLRGRGGADETRRTEAEVLVGLNDPDDAAIVKMPEGKQVTIQTMDFFRAFIDDTYLFGRIAANHALSDCHAMNAEPVTAMALAMVPFASEERMEEDLFQMMAGATSVLKEEKCELVGGHTCEGLEMGLGFAVVGAAASVDELMRKGGMREGDVLILTKPIGTGVLFAADMRGQAEGLWIQAALESMQKSSRSAACILQQHGATSCTDVTGFGLLGHLIEMAKASDNVSVELVMENVPILDGAVDCVRNGIFSSLQPQNVRLGRAVRMGHGAEGKRQSPLYPLLYDPQTAGGLLASVPSSSARTCIAKLQEAGYTRASNIGKVLERNGGGGSNGEGELCTMFQIVCI